MPIVSPINDLAFDVPDLSAEQRWLLLAVNSRQHVREWRAVECRQYDGLVKRGLLVSQPTGRVFTGMVLRRGYRKEKPVRAEQSYSLAPLLAERAERGRAWHRAEEHERQRLLDVAAAQARLARREELSALFQVWLDARAGQRAPLGRVLSRVLQAVTLDGQDDATSRVLAAQVTAHLHG